MTLWFAGRRRLRPFLLVTALLSGAAPTLSWAQVVRPGDRIFVRLLGDTMPFVDTLTVAADGALALPRLGAVAIGTWPASAIGDSLRLRYARYLRNPVVDVVVLRRVAVGGEVRKPDVYYVNPATSVTDLIARAGGLTDAASPRKVTLRREGMDVHLRDWRNVEGAMRTIESGDEVYVARRPWLALNFVPVASTAAVLTSIWVAVRR